MSQLSFDKGTVYLERVPRRFRLGAHFGAFKRRINWIPVMALFIFGCSTANRPSPPKGVRCYSRFQQVRIRPTDSREWKKPGYQFIQFAALKSGEIVAPLLQVEETRFTGPFGGARTELVWQKTFLPLGEGSEDVDLPKDEEIEQHLLVARRIRLGDMELDFRWRVWEIAAPRVRNDEASFLIMPGFDTLGLLENRKDGEDLLAKSRDARAFRIELSK